MSGNNTGFYQEIRKMSTSYCHLLISTVFVVVSRVGCLRVTGVLQDSASSISDVPE